MLYSTKAIHFILCGDVLFTAVQELSRIAASGITA